MATVTRYWRTDASAGGDGTTNTTSGGNHAYQGLEDLVSAEATNLVSAGNILHAICTVGGQEASSALFDLSGFTTDASNYVIIECQGDAHHSGVSRENGGTGYQLTRSGDVFRGLTAKYQLKGFEIMCSNAGSFSAFEDDSSASVGGAMEEMIFSVNNSGVIGNYCVDLSNGGTFTLTNCLIIGYGKRGMDCRGSTVTMDHCTVVSNNYAIMVDTNTLATNVVACADTGRTEDWYQEANASSSNCASVDGSSPNTGEQTITTLTDEFTTWGIDPASADLTLKSGSVLIDNGTGSLATDITGGARSGTADIGCFNYQQAGVSYNIPVPAGPVR
jgi:hypothetical protein